MKKKDASFAVIELACVAISCIALSTFPELSWYPLILAGLPFIIRVAWPEKPLRLSAFEFLIVGFLLTAFVGLWAAYDAGAALQKFYLLIGTALLFYSLSLQPTQNLGLIAISLGVFGVISTVIFLLITDWTSFPADFGIITQIGLKWAKIRPVLSLQSRFEPDVFHANIVGGINAMLLPFCLAAGIHYGRQGRKYLAGLNVFLLILLGFGLLLSSSRAAWAAACFGLLIFGLLHYRKSSEFLFKNSTVLILIPATVIFLGVTTPYLLANNFTNSTEPITSLTSFGSRLRIAQQTYFLISGYPFTGGGLGSFPGLYSQYILLIPHLMFRYSHNLYLDVALEQGVAGFTMWVGIIMLCTLTLKSTIFPGDKQVKHRFFATALYASLMILLLHGIADDPLYSSIWSLPLLFVIPGLSIATSNPISKPAMTLSKLAKGSLVGLMITAGFLIIFIKPLRALWYANIGAVNMAKLELADWPSGEWNDVNDLQSYQSVETYFAKALSLQENSRIANYRVGLILLSQQKFQEAVDYLERSLLVAPNHRGIKKSLGYCYAWLGKFDQASTLLVQIPEAQTEMETYTWWWQTQNRKDLATNAAIMAEILSSR